MASAAAAARAPSGQVWSCRWTRPSLALGIEGGARDGAQHDCRVTRQVPSAFLADDRGRAGSVVAGRLARPLERPRATFGWCKQRLGRGAEAQVATEIDEQQPVASLRITATVRVAWSPVEIPKHERVVAEHCPIHA